MTDLLRRVAYSAADGTDVARLLADEWLVTNGLGGYAAGTVGGVLTRRHHGLLVAALPAPWGRTVMLSSLWERLRFPDRTTTVLTGEDRAGIPPELLAARHLTELRLEEGLPVWRYEAGGALVEKRLVMPYGQNTVHLTYRLLAGPPAVRLTLRPSMHVRAHNAPVSEPLAEPYTLTAVAGRFEIAPAGGLPVLRLTLHGSGAFTVDPARITGVGYRAEASRGHESYGELWSPGYFRADLGVGEAVTLIASTESWEPVTALEPAAALEAERRRLRRLVATAHPAARRGMGAELVLAADQFIVTPVGRARDAARARAGGDEARTIIAGYHWFTDWGRDTMIALAGLTLATGRHAEAGYILRTFGHYVRDGLIPNVFPEGETEGLYHTADATLWFFEALHRYLAATGDHATLLGLLPTLTDIVDHHVRGTRFGIGVDPADGLLRQGAPGHPLTWMDAKVGDWVVTPRRGKAVEINALWYNALRLLEEWLEAERGPVAAKPIGELADRAPRRSTRAFGMRRAAGSTTWWTARAATIRFAGPTRSWRWRSLTPCSRQPAGPRCWTRCASGCSPRSGCARSIPSTTTTSPATTATCGRVTPPTIRARCGRGSSGRSSRRGCARTRRIGRARAAGSRASERT